VTGHALGPADVLLGIAASGGTSFTVAAVRAARAAGALTIGLSNNTHSPLLEAAEIAVPLDTGAEAIAGSTRMKAGTAQKAALNLFSTALMVRLGRVYRGQMVDMQARNAKLRARALRMLRGLTGCDEAAGRAALEAAGGKVKLAVLVVRGVALPDAVALLAAHGGSLRAALGALGGGSSRPADGSGGPPT
jgi:N-acetylmuramic acid 6-phosphate etherase